MPPERILVINPNSSARVTQAIDVALMGLRAKSPFTIDVMDIPQAPAGVALQSDADRAAPLVQALIAQQKAAAYAIACFSDPGVHGARENMPCTPIRGIGESAILHALTKGERFGIIALSEKSVFRQRRLIRGMGVGERYAGSYPVDTSAEGATDHRLLERMVDAAGHLRQQGADIIIMGCAGMAHFQTELEKRCALPVIEPTKAAVALLIGDLCLLPPAV
ncbi:MAG: aspartate/glutamate racemase family protein [Acetobacter sp.]